jgi:biopolymer transport protein ExbD
MDLTPFVDVVFSLLLFFVLTSSYIVQPGISIRLPKVASSDAVKGSRVIIVIDRSGRKFMQGHVSELDLGSLDAELRRLAAEGVNVLIKADADARLHFVVEVWDRCKIAGIASDKLSIATETAPGEAPSDGR